MSARKGSSVSRFSMSGCLRFIMLSILLGNLAFVTACASTLESIPWIEVDEAPSDPKELVMGVQKMLSEKGFNPGPIDGLDGPATRTALRKFQTARGLPTTGNISKTAYNQLAADGKRKRGSSQYSAASKKMRRDSSVFNQSYAEACLVGGLAGAAAAILTGKNNTKRVATGAGIGCLAGAGANYWLQDERKQAAFKEEDSNQMLSQLQDENKKLANLVSSSREVVAEDRRKIREIDSAYKNKQISLEQAEQQMADVDDNKAHLEKTLANLEERKENWATLSQNVKSKQTSAQQQAIDVEISGLERKISALKTELSSLEQARSVSAIG